MSCLALALPVFRYFWIRSCVSRSRRSSVSRKSADACAAQAASSSSRATCASHRARICALATLAEEFGAPHFIDRLVGVLHDVKLVVDDAGLGKPVLNTVGERWPHVHAHRL